MNSKWTHVVFIILIVAVSVLVYYNTTKFGYVADDSRLISNQADFLKDWGNLKTVFSEPFPTVTYEPIPFYRPIITLANFINFHLYGKTAFDYHRINLGLHTLNAILLYLLIFLLFKRELFSLLTALFFSAHPIHINSVVWISGRTDVIACFFVFLTVIFFIKRKDHTGILRAFLYALSILSYLFSLFSKEIALAVPLFLFLWDYASEKEGCDSLGHPVTGPKALPGREPVQKKIIKKIIPYLPFVIVATLYVVLRFVVLGDLGTGKPYTSANIFQRFLTAFAIYFYYFKKFFFPVYLNYSPRVLTITSLFSLKFWGTLIFFAVVLAVGLSLRRTAKEVSFGIFWILATLVPVLNLVPLYASVKEWWAYIPSVGFCLILGRLAEAGISWEKEWFGIKLPKRKPKEKEMPEAESTVPAEIPPVLERGEEFSTTSSKEFSTPPMAGFSTEGKEILEDKSWKIPERLLIRGGHALSLFFALLLIFYAFTIQSRARVFRDDYHLWTNTSQIAPYDAVAHNAIGAELKRRGVTRWAKMAFQKAIQADPNFAEARNNLGAILDAENQSDSALAQIKEAIRIDPGFVDAYNNLGIVYGRKRVFDSAIIAFQQALQLDPTYFSAYKNLGIIYAAMEDFSKALWYYERALKLAPNKQEAESLKQEINQIRVRGY